MKKTIIAAAALVAMTACNKTLIETPMTDSNYGYINLGITADTEMVVTKAEPDFSNYNVSLYSGADLKWTKEYKDIVNDDWTVPAGTYKIYVENLTADEAAPASEKGSVRVAGTVENISVKAGFETPVNISCKPINSQVTVGYAEGFTDIFKTPVVAITDQSRSFDMTWGHVQNNAVFYAAGSQLSWTLSVSMENASGQTINKTYNSESPITTEADKWTQINFSSDSANGTISITITVDGEIDTITTIPVIIDPFEGSSNN